MSKRAFQQSSLPVIRVADLAARRGMLASQFYGDPTADIECVGITGTNGKTSIAYHVSDLTNILGKLVDIAEHWERVPRVR